MSSFVCFMLYLILLDFDILLKRDFKMRIARQLRHILIKTAKTCFPHFPLQMAMKWIWCIVMIQLCAFKTITTINTANKMDSTAGKDLNTVQNLTNNQLNQTDIPLIHYLHLTPHNKTIKVIAHSSSPKDNSSFTTVHIHLGQGTGSSYSNSSLSSSELYSKQCSIQQGELNNICRKPIADLDNALQIIKSLITKMENNHSRSMDNELKQYKNIICPSSEEWVTFTTCYCTKCAPELTTVPNQTQWNEIWKQTTFCTLPAAGTNLCQYMELKVLNTSTVNIDPMFRNAWNTEMRSETTLKKVNHEVVTTTEIEFEKNELMRVEPDIDEDDVTLIKNVSSMFAAHPLIYLWTIVFASVVTLFSFFILYR
eukprot:256767_1